MKKGISILSLGVMVIIIIAVGSVAVMSSKNSIKGLNQTKFVTEYTMVESLIEKFYIKNGYYPTFGSINLNIDIDAYPNQFVTETISNNTLELQKINLETIEAKDLELGNGKTENDYYAISSTGVLYYVKGIVIEENVYYLVTDNLRQVYTKDI